MAHTFAGLGKRVYLWEQRDGRLKKFRQVLWGDWLEIDPDRQATSEFMPIIWAKRSRARRKQLWIRKDETTDERPLEIIFVDVGQGDGAVLITPERGDEERIVVIDAGESDNMCRFLNGRFKAYRGFNFYAAVITHPDADHYFGFKKIFEDDDIGFEHVYHNGLMELPVSGDFEKFGGTFRDEIQQITYIRRLWQTDAEVREDFGPGVDVGRFWFPGLVRAGLENPRIGDFRMLSTRHGTIHNGRCYMPDFAPADGRSYVIEVLGPVVETDSQGTPRLRRISGYGKTKNGHSVLLRLEFGDFSILFGGDLNKPAERFLLRHYTGQSRLPQSGPAYSEALEAARNRFRSEVMKTCHHGAADVTDMFLDAVNPACFIISSGDAEGHVHPRPDLLGRLGKFGRGDSPVLLSTELQRSTRDSESPDAIAALLRLIDTLASDPSPATLDEAKRRIRHLTRDNVDVYGAIYLKTDGHRLITAFKIETGSEIKKWFYFEYRINANGELRVTH